MLTVLKLGSSVVADERGMPREGLLAELCGLVAERRAAGEGVVIVSSGAIARGVAALGLPARPQGIAQLQAASAVGQGKLFPLYDRLLAERQLTAAQVLLTALDLHERTRYLNARRALETLLEWGAVPVINENDTTATDEISFGDNDFLAAQVAALLQADRLLLLTDVEGVYTANPREDPQAQLLGEVADPGKLLAEISVGSHSRWGSGGIRSKLLAAQIATAAGVETVVCNGLEAEAVAVALAGGRRGTRFPPAGEREPAFKLWLRYAKPTSGRVVVDRGAVEALRRRGSSLLPVGVVSVEGEFAAGEAVEVVSEEGEVVAKGIVSLSSQELSLVRGLDSARVRELLPDGEEEAIHRDHLVLA